MSAIVNALFTPKINRMEKRLRRFEEKLERAIGKARSLIISPAGNCGLSSLATVGGR